MAEKMTSAERNALLKLIARQARVADSDVKALAAQRLAEFERQATEKYDAAKLGVADLIAECNEALDPLVAQIRERIEAYCDANDIPAELRPVVVGAGGPIVSTRARAYYDQGNRIAELRRVAKAEIDLAVKSARIEIERSRSEIEARILVSGIESDEGQALLASLPKAEALLPSLDLLAIEASRGGAR